MLQALILKSSGNGNGKHEYIFVDRSPFRIGRKPDNNAQISQPDVSGTHAEFRFEQGGWWLDDAGSTNGTFLNGKRIDRRATVKIGDLLHFASRAFQVVPAVDRTPGLMATKVLCDSSEIKSFMDLLQIINGQKTYPFFQPIVELRGRRPVGWEALGRAVSQAGPVSPATLLELAEENNVESKLSGQFRESAQACAECRHCWRADAGALLFVNLHPNELADPHFPDLLEALARLQTMRWYRPVLEVPESWVGNGPEMQRLVKQIRGAGILVAYDDFGTGQSRIPDLINAPPDFLKLDRELIASIASNRIKHGLIKAIVEACKELRVTTIGEGIESAEELAACIDMGIDLGQGFLLGRPAAAYHLFGADPASLPGSCPFVRLNMLPERTT